MYFPVIPLDGLSTGLSVSDCFEPSSRSTPARDLTSLHTTIRADFLLSFTFILSLSLLPSRTGVRGAGADGTEFLMPTTEITLHLYTLFPTRENYSPLPSTGSPYLFFYPTHRRHTLLPPPDGASSHTTGSPRMLCMDQ